MQQSGRFALSDDRAGTLGEGQSPLSDCSFAAPHLSVSGSRGIVPLGCATLRLARLLCVRTGALLLGSVGQVGPSQCRHVAMNPRH